MSNKVSNLVYSRKVGSAHRKAILAYMSDKASDGGEGVYCSKGTIADETEIARSTVFKIIKEMILEGILIEVGKRSCTNGHTVIYNMVLSKIEAFPLADPEREKKRNQSASRTSPVGDQSASRTPPVREPDPDQSASRTQTTLGTTLEQEGGGGSARELFEFHSRLSEVCGPDLATVEGLEEAGRWLSLPGVDAEKAIASVSEQIAAAEGQRINSMAYFTPAMCRLSGLLSSPALTPTIPNQPTAKAARPQRDFDAMKVRALARLNDEVSA